MTAGKETGIAAERDEEQEAEAGDLSGACQLQCMMTALPVAEPGPQPRSPHALHGLLRPLVLFNEKKFLQGQG